MSNKLSGYVWDGCAAAGLKLSEVAIMARLADFSSDEGKSWPSVTTIARQIGAGESTVRTALGKLEREGWISRQQRRAGNRNASNIYQLNVEKLRLAAHASESDSSKSDASKFDGSKSDASKSSKKGGFHPSESGGDPSVTSTPDPSSNKTFCQPPADPEVEITDRAIQVLKHLNQVTASRYQNCKSSLENIRGRLREGFTTDELVLVVDFSVERWASNPDFSANLNPVTLFRPAKFPAYLSSATKWEAAGRLPRSQWPTGTQAKQPASYVNMDFSKQEYSAPTSGWRT